MMKKKLRALYKSVRNGISESEKKKADTCIFTRFVNSDLFADSEIILIYISVGSEPDTLKLMDYSLRNGKRVAVPHCIGLNMNFYFIESTDCFVDGEFGIPTVIPENENLVFDFKNTVCVVPALSFDRFGNRLGYGGGYYDRFLYDKNFPTVGLCYERCVATVLPAEEHDIRVDYILNENRLTKL